MPKDLGGMGFRDLWEFNSAMLTKTAWRLQDQQTMIWARVMKGLYFLRGDLMSAKKGARSSWVWASILTRRDVLQKYGIWKVGNGKKIKVFHDAWVPGIQGHSLRETGEEDEQENIYLEKLITPTDRRWELNQISLTTKDEEIKSIKCIYLSKQTRDDRLVLLSTVNGIATHKIVYRRLRESTLENSTRDDDGRNEEMEEVMEQ